eukprot:4192921-Pyramimonas_sp.AAC.1
MSGIRWAWLAASTDAERAAYPPPYGLPVTPAKQPQVKLQDCLPAPPEPFPIEDVQVSLWIAAAKVLTLDPQEYKRAGINRLGNYQGPPTGRFQQLGTQFARCDYLLVGTTETRMPISKSAR